MFEVLHVLLPSMRDLFFLIAFWTLVTLVVGMALLINGDLHSSTVRRQVIDYYIRKDSAVKWYCLDAFLVWLAYYNNDTTFVVVFSGFFALTYLVTAVLRSQSFRQRYHKAIAIEIAYVVPV